MKNKKAICLLSISLILVLLLSLSATVLAEEAAQEQITLTYWHVGPFEPLESATMHLIDTFMEKYPNITVEVEGFPFSEYFTKVDTATAAGTGPDVFWVDSTHVTKYVFNDMIIPLTDFVPDDFNDDFFELTLQDAMYRNGELYAIPLHQSTQAVLYNEDLIQAAGLEPPKSYDEAWDFEEYRQAMEAVSKIADDGTVETWAYTQHYNYGYYSLQPLMVAYSGHGFMDPEGTTYDGYTNSDDMVEAETWFCELYRDNLAPGLDRIPDIFQSGKVAFYEANPFVLVDIQNRFPDLNVGVMPEPCGERCAVQSGSYHIGIHANSEHSEEAWLLVDHITNFDGHRYWVDTTGYMPARYSVYEDIPRLKEYPWSIFVDGLINHAISREGNLAWPVFNTEIQNAVTNCAAGSDVKEELDRVVDLAQAELDMYK
jgi:fructooligosaccharide transport system substrate-binding protein